jgi:pilus assembly protein CpaB
LLRRTQRIVLREDEDDTPEAPFVAEPAIATGPVPDRRTLEQWLAEVERAAAAQPKGERKGLDALRAEVQRTLVTSDGEVISNTGQVWRNLLKPTRLALLAVALVAGGVAAYFATTMDQGTPVVAEPAPVAEQAAAEPAPPPPAPMQQILVAKAAIALGDRLTPDKIEWKSWPTDAMRDDYISDAQQPKAPQEMSGAIARFEFFPGEPIRLAKLASPGDGYLSTVLEPGQRGVSLPVQPDVAAGGFIQPNDHVDVILTQAIGGRQVADTVLANVRVLAIAHRLGNVGAPPPPSDSPDAPEEASGPATFSDGVIATLALDSEQAEIITAARNAGTLSLVLRSISDFAVPAARNSDEINANQQIRLTSPFWTN